MRKKQGEVHNLGCTFQLCICNCTSNIGLQLNIYETFLFAALSKPAVSTHSQIHLLKIMQQMSLPCDTADMSAVGHSGHDCCVTQQKCLLWPIAAKSAG